MPLTSAARTTCVCPHGRMVDLLHDPPSSATCSPWNAAKTGGDGGTPWDDQFPAVRPEKTAQGDNTTSLTEKQIDVLQRIYRKNFSD